MKRGKRNDVTHERIGENPIVSFTKQQLENRLGGQ